MALSLALMPVSVQPGSHCPRKDFTIAQGEKTHRNMQGMWPCARQFFCPEMDATEHRLQPIETLTQMYIQSVDIELLTNTMC